MGTKKTLHGDERTIILRVLKFFEHEKKQGRLMIPIDQVLNRTCAATGVSMSTVMRIKKEGEEMLENMPATSSPMYDQPGTSSYIVPKLPSPPGHRKPKESKLGIDDIMITSLKEIVESFYTVNKEVPTLNKILSVAKKDINFPGQKETLRKIMINKLGYTFKKRQKKGVS